MTRDRLTLPEELLLLSLDDRKGTVSFSDSTALPYGLAGAALLELALSGLLVMEGKNLVPGGRGSARDELLDPLLEIVRDSGRPRSAKHWVGRFGRSAKRLKLGLLERLVDRGILHEEEGRILWVFPTRRFPETDPTPEHRIRERVRGAILGESRSDDRTLALVSLVHVCGLVNSIFEKGERKDAKRRAKEIASREPLGAAVGDVLVGIRAAIATAVAAGAAAAS